MEKETKLLFTSESVTEGHPDKMCDKISDAILDAYLELDPNSRVACETFAGKDFIIVSGEITSNADVDIEAVVRKTVVDIGYDRDEVYFNGNDCDVIIKTHKQSPDIAMGVDENSENNKSIGAGDQGIMFGYACDETPEYMPMSLMLAHALTEGLADLRKAYVLPYLGPDGKSQVTVEYDIEGNIIRIDTILISTQHDETVTQEEIEQDLYEHLILRVIPHELLDSNTNILVNPTGRFVIGGPAGDTGLTGRKIIVDTYGGHARHGGGAFSGKDCTKVDRSAAYMARYIAKNIVAAGIVKRCEIQLAYAIGVSEPVSIHVNTLGLMNPIWELKLSEIIQEEFDLTPAGIINKLRLREPIFSKTSAYGHFGKEYLPWELLDKAQDICNHYIRKF